MNGWGGNASIMHQGQQEINMDILKKGITQQSSINIQGWTLNLNWSDKKDKELIRLFRNKFNSIQCFGHQCNVFPNLSRAKSMVRDIKGKTIKQKLLVRVIEGSRYQG